MGARGLAAEKKVASAGNGESGLELESLWPDMPDEQRMLWEGLPQRKKETALRRLEAIRGVERGPEGRARYPDMMAAAAAAGMSRSSFYAVHNGWRRAPSLSALGVNLTRDGPGRTASIELRDRMLERVRMLLAEQPDLGNAEVRRKLGEAFGTTPAFATVRRLVLDAQRSEPPKEPFGRRVVLDSAGLDVWHDPGMPVRLYALFDLGTGLVMGWTIWSLYAPAGAYARAINHAFRGVRNPKSRELAEGYGLTALALDRIAAELPASVEMHVLPDDARALARAVDQGSVELVTEGTLGRLLVDALGERLGRIWIGAGCRDAGRSYRTGRVEDMPKLTAALRRQIGAEIHDHNLRRLSLMERTAADDPARAAVGRLEELLMPVERALSAI